MAVVPADIAAQRLGAHPVPKRTLDELILEQYGDLEDGTPADCGGENGHPIWHRSISGELATAHNARLRNVAVVQFVTSTPRLRLQQPQGKYHSDKHNEAYAAVPSDVSWRSTGFLCLSRSFSLARTGSYRCHRLAAGDQLPHGLNVRIYHCITIQNGNVPR